MKNSAVKIFVIFLLIITVLSSLFLSPTAYASQYYVTDTYSDTQYTISQEGSLVTINSDTISSRIYIDNTIIQATCYAGNLTFLCTSVDDNDNVVFYAYFYNTSTEGLSFFVTNHTASTNAPAFTADKFRRIYLTDGNDKRVMYIYSEYSVATAVCSEPIVQLMCTDGEKVLAFSESGVFIYANGVFTKIDNINALPPCRYNGNNTITDRNGTKFKYENSTLSLLNPPASNTSPLPAEDVFVDNNFIYLSQSKTYASLSDYFDIKKHNFIVYKQDGTTLSSGQLGTGMTALYNSKKYTMIVLGDLTGEGNVNSRDLNMLMKHLTREASLSSITAKAADLNSDNIINTKDLLILAGLY